ncbi:MAG: family 78 glycoside hydrolase catalytic domain [Balneolaceae bacterium]|nr:family 78 glycoside hydrolase catalytic domain [Balneolaceae bacterium]
MSVREISVKFINRFLIIVILFYPLQLLLAQNGSDLSVYDLEVEYFTNPVGIDDSNPRLSWKIESDQRNTIQRAYQVQVSKSSDFSEVVWDTGVVNSDQSLHVRYEGPKLESRERYYWRNRVWDNHGNRSGWSEPAFWEMGLLNENDWQARWIEAGFEQDSTVSSPSPMFRNEFKIDREVASARVYVTSHGVYEMEINGKRVGDRFFTPGWTSYNNRLQYQTYDITDFLETGDNAVGVTLGDGWYSGYLVWGDTRNHYGSTLGVLAQIEVTYKDGSTETIGTDKSWTSSTGAILASDIYNGETYDARLENRGWSETGYDESDWSVVTVANHSKDHLIAPEGPPVRKIQTIRPKQVLQTPEGDTVVDFGQNMVGWVQLSAEGPRGTEITLEHAEVLDKDGNFYMANIRAAEQLNTYIMKGEGVEVWEPSFTFQGFRYVKVEGYPGELTLDDLTGVVLHSDMDPTGHFQTSNDLLNQLQHNIVWGQKGNFLDIPTDCPQRDERLGWTGDIQVFASTACFNMDASGFLTKWLRDVEADQNESGSVPYVVPNVLGEQAVGSSGWGDASVVVPWTLYQAYGDKQILETQYESMKGWVDFMKERSAMDSTTYLWDNNFTFGDWLSFNSTASDYPGAYTDKALISTAFFGHSTDLLARSARVLGKDSDAKDYEDLFENIKDAFQHEYLTPSGRIMSNTQTAYLLALQFDLLSDEMESKAAEYLISRVNERGHLTTGFLGTPHLNPILTQFGYSEEAYELMLRKEYPSWLYPVTKGATTIWERWDGMKPDSTFQNPGMNSFNHYAYGAIGEWLYKSVAGIDQKAPGYKEISIHPVIGGKLEHSRGVLNSSYGKIETSWNLDRETFTISVEIPENTTATVFLPEAMEEQVTENGENLRDGPKGVINISQREEGVEVKVGSGHYLFSYPAGKLASGLASEMNLSTPVADLLENDQTRSILENYIPAMIESVAWNQFGNASLTDLAETYPDQLTSEVLNQIDSDFSTIEFGESYSVHADDSLAKLIANQQSRDILNKELPDLMQSPWLSQVMGYNLEYASLALPEGLKIDEGTIKKIQNELNDLAD